MIWKIGVYFQKNEGSANALSCLILAKDLYITILPHPIP